MGHDVVAFKGSSEELNMMAVSALQARLESGDLGSFDEFQKELTEKAVATAMRRSSFDRYNKVIYQLCGAEFTYGGWSGNQGEVWMSLEDVDHALAQIEHMRDTDIPALSDEEIEGMKERLQAASSATHDTGVELHLYTVDPKTGEKTEMTGLEREEALEKFDQAQGEWGSTCDDNLEIEYRFLTEIKTCMRDEGLEKIRLWFG